MKLSEIKTGGEPFHIAAKAYIAGMSDDEVLTMAELSERIGRAVPSNGMVYLSLKDHGIKVKLRRSVYVYGNPKALRALRKQLAL